MDFWTLCRICRTHRLSGSEYSSVLWNSTRSSFLAGKPVSALCAAAVTSETDGPRGRGRRRAGAATPLRCVRALRARGLSADVKISWWVRKRKRKRAETFSHVCSARGAQLGLRVKRQARNQEGCFKKKKKKDQLKPRGNLLSSESKISSVIFLKMCRFKIWRWEIFNDYYGK